MTVQITLSNALRDKIIDACRRVCSESLRGVGWPQVGDIALIRSTLSNPVGSGERFMLPDGVAWGDYAEAVHHWANEIKEGDGNA
jgi:hypothetical protein